MKVVEDFLTATRRPRTYKASDDFGVPRDFNSARIAEADIEGNQLRTLLLKLTSHQTQKTDEQEMRYPYQSSAYRWRRTNATSFGLVEANVRRCIALGAGGR